MAQVSTPDTETEQGKTDVAATAAVGDGPGSSKSQPSEAGSVDSGARGRRVDNGGGVIDLDKLMQSIDMTRVSPGLRTAFSCGVADHGLCRARRRLRCFNNA